MDLRAATVADLDAITEVALAAFPFDPQWDYRFPHRHEFPEDTQNYTKIGYRAFFDNPKGATHVIVVMAPSLEDPAIKKLVAMAVWEVMNLKSSETKHSVVDPPKSGSRRDAHPKRMEAFTNSMEVAHRRYFGDVYGTDHIRLRILATHPDYQRRGAGTKLCSWGIDLAEKNQTYISVFASPMGKKLYAHLGFKELAIVVVQAEGEEEKCSQSKVRQNVVDYLSWALSILSHEGGNCRRRWIF